MDATVERLFQAARDAQARAYVPYSRFKVGAAILPPPAALHRACRASMASA